MYKCSIGGCELDHVTYVNVTVGYNVMQQISNNNQRINKQGCSYSYAVWYHG